METAPCTACSAVPEDYRCPITLKVFAQAVVASDGFTYEKSAIQRYLAIHRDGPACSPKTLLPLPDARLIPNHTLMAAIASPPKAGPKRDKQLARIALEQMRALAELRAEAAPQPPRTEAAPQPPALHRSFRGTMPGIALIALLGAGVGEGFQLGAECLFGSLPPPGWGAGAGAVWFGGSAALGARAYVSEDLAALDASRHLIFSGLGVVGMGLLGCALGGMFGALGKYAGCQNNFFGCHFIDIGMLGAQLGAGLGTAVGASYAAYAIYKAARLGPPQFDARAALHSAGTWMRNAVRSSVGDNLAA